jgi:uncharacterized membrane protein
MKSTLLLVIGLLCIAMGLLWIGQGTGYIPWPEVSPMINVMPWAWRGAALAIVGLGLVIWSRRR